MHDTHTLIILAEQSFDLTLNLLNHLPEISAEVPHRPRHRIRIAEWSSRAAFGADASHNPPMHAARREELRFLMRSNDVVLILEAHGAMEIVTICLREQTICCGRFFAWPERGGWNSTPCEASFVARL